uniref:Uncharacterized protein n=1 Tax=viral metagenome TaxID=1070528 RepID=A0A6H2A171_9ZZZZ
MNKTELAILLAHLLGDARRAKLPQGYHQVKMPERGKEVN